MKIAIPIWNKRVAPVFDVADRWLSATVNEQQWRIDTTFQFKTTDPREKARELMSQNITHVICGAIPRCLERRLQTAGCFVFSFVKGEPEQVLEAFTKNGLDVPFYKMPGCQKRRHRKCR